MQTNAATIKEIKSAIDQIVDDYSQDTLPESRINEYESFIEESENVYEGTVPKSVLYVLFELQSLAQLFKGNRVDAIDFAKASLYGGRKSYSEIIPAISRLKEGEELNINGRVTGVTNQQSSLYYFSPTLVFIFSAISLGLYNLFWLYQQFQAKKQEEPNIYPFWWSLFAVFTSFGLFNWIGDKAKNAGAIISDSTPSILATVYVASILVSAAISNGSWDFNAQGVYGGYMFAAFAISALWAAIFAKMQSIANSVVRPEEIVSMYAKKTGGMYTVVIIGTLLSVSMFAPLLLRSEPETSLDVSTIMQDKYESCTADIEAKRSGLDTTNQVAIDAFNKEVADCNEIRQSIIDAAE